MSIKKDVRHSSRKALEQLGALRDEAKLQLHLLGMDARRAFSELETQIVSLEGRASREGEHAFESLTVAAQELTRALNEFMTTHVNASVGLLTSVRTIMTTHVRTCQADDSLGHAAHLMWNEDCGIVPVTRDHHVVGVITDRDICMATYTQGQAPGELRVEATMSKQLFSCSADDSLATALTTMRTNRVRRVPVLTLEGKLLGLLSLADIVRWAQPLGNPSIDATITETLAAISARSPQKLASAAE
jgi:CBS domain-containing protein